MNLEEAKQHWQISQATESQEWLAENIGNYWSHPDLKKMRRQLLFEGTCWTFFLFLYYTALDGYLRSGFWNAALVIGFILLIAHSYLGYYLGRQQIGAGALVATLTKQISRLRWFSWLSIFLRITTTLVFFGFMSSFKISEDANFQLWFLLTVTVWSIVQFIVLYLIWKRRIDRLQKTLNELS